MSDQTVRIRALNDRLRLYGEGGRIFITYGLEALGLGFLTAVIQQMRDQTDFASDNDPYGEHDFGCVEHDGKRVFWKIDYYDHTLTSGSPDPADPSVTARVLTLMLADEY